MYYIQNTFAVKGDSSMVDKREYCKNYRKYKKTLNYEDCLGSLVKSALSQLSRGYLDDDLYIKLISHNFNIDSIMAAKGVEDTIKIQPVKTKVRKLQ